MIQEEKSLLLQDLSARLPYGVKVQPSGSASPHKFVGYDKNLVRIDTDQRFELENIKPYLRPMSSMTIKEIKEYSEMTYKGSMVRFDVSKKNHNMFVEVDLKHLDWFNAHHFDYRGLIEKGLAIEAPEGMYNHLVDATVEHKGSLKL